MGLSPYDIGIGRLFWTIREAVIVADADRGTIVLWNPAAEKLFGYTAEEALALPLEMLVPESLRAQHRAGLAHYAASGHGRHVDAGTPLELPALHKYGREIAIELTLNPLEDLPLAGRYVLALVRDLTERRRAEVERIALARSEVARADAELALQQRDEFVTLVSHDLNNPLTAIRAQAQVLQLRLEASQAEDAGALLDSAKRIEAITSRMARMISDLLDVARLQAGRAIDLDRQTTDLVVLAHLAAATAQQATEGHTIRVDAAEPELLGAWDAERLERVLDNLLGNAVKYSPRGGSIVLRVRRDGECALLEVVDRGIGIPPADLPHVFERYRRGGNVEGRIAGTGIGLAGVKQIVEQHGGCVSVSSDVGAGSTFCVRLPLAEPRAPAVPARSGDT